MICTVILPPHRMTEGKIRFQFDNDASEFRCLGRSDQSGAESVGNPTRNPLKPFGDLPTGQYKARLQGPYKPVTESTKRSYGEGDVWLLISVAGDALEAAENGRSGLLIHGGALGAPMPPNALRPTHGCLRVDDSTTSWMTANCPSEFRVDVIEEI